MSGLVVCFKLIYKLYRYVVQFSWYFLNRNFLRFWILFEYQIVQFKLQYVKLSTVSMRLSSIRENEKSKFGFLSYKTNRYKNGLLCLDEYHFVWMVEYHVPGVHLHHLDFVMPLHHASSHIWSYIEIYRGKKIWWCLLYHLEIIFPKISINPNTSKLHTYL